MFNKAYTGFRQSATIVFPYTRIESPLYAIRGRHFLEFQVLFKPKTPNSCIIQSNLMFGRREKIFGVFFSSRGAAKS